MRVWAARQLLRRLLGTVVRCRVWTVRCCCLTWCRVMLGMCCVAWLMLVCLVVCPMAMCPAWVVPCGTQLLVVVGAAVVAAAVCRQAVAFRAIFQTCLQRKAFLRVARHLPTSLIRALFLKVFVLVAIKLQAVRLRCEVAPQFCGPWHLH